MLDDTPDLTGHPTVEPVHFGEASGVPGVHTPPRPAGDAPARASRRPRAADQAGDDPATTAPAQGDEEKE